MVSFLQEKYLSQGGIRSRGPNSYRVVAKWRFVIFIACITFVLLPLDSHCCCPSLLLWETPIMGYHLC